MKILGMEVETKTNGDLTIDKKQMNAFYAERGLDKDVFDKIDAANQEFVKGATPVLVDKVCKDKATAKLFAGAGNWQNRLTVFDKRTYMDRETKKEIVKHGVVKYSIRHTLPGSFKSDLIEISAKKVEDALK